MTIIAPSAAHWLAPPDSYWRKTQGALMIELDDPRTGLPYSRMTCVGSVTAEIDNKVEYLDGRNNMEPLRPRSIRRATQADSSLKVTMMNFGGQSLAQLYSSPDQVMFTQNAHTGAAPAGGGAAPATDSTEFDNVQQFQILELKDANGLNVLNAQVDSAGVTDGAGNVLMPGVDYRILPQCGLIQVNTVPPSGKYVVAWAGPAVVAAAAQQMFSLLQSPDATGRILVVQKNLNGPNLFHVIPKVHFGTADKITLIGGGNEWQQASFEFTILEASDYPGREYGFAVIVP